jgi:hypothetical protein
MPNWLIVLLAAVIPSGIGLAGVWLGQRGNAKLAKQTLETQRVLASDAARREWRMQQVAPYREAIEERVQVWLEIRNAMGGLDAKTLHALYGELDFLSLTDEERETHLSLEKQKNLQVVLDRLHDPQFDSLLTGLITVPDDGIQVACQRFIAAEGKLKAEYTSKEIGEIVLAMRRVQADLNHAVERYITSL